MKQSCWTPSSWMLLLGGLLLMTAGTHADVVQAAPPPVVAPAIAPADASPMQAARAWLGSLKPAQYGRANLPYTSPNRRSWEYRPVSRLGLPLRDMTTTQRTGAWALWTTALAPGGLADIRAVRRHETNLRRQQGAWRSPDLYFLTVFGTPKDGASWAWRLEGHHLSINMTYVGDRVVSMTPYFVGGPPALLSRNGSGTTRKDALALRLAASMNTKQAAAIESTSVPGDITQQPGVRAWVPGARWGIAGNTLRPEQQTMLLQVINAFGSGVGHTLATAETLSKVRFAWRGRLGARSQYYRILGPGFSLEYRNLDTHTHAIWRSPIDFGVRR